MHIKSFKKGICSLLISGFFFSLLVLVACGGGATGGKSDPVPDTTAPTVISTNPVTGATGIAKNSTISVTFNEAIDSSTVDADSFIVNDGSSDLTGSISLSTDKKTAVFTPSADMAYDLIHTVTVKDTITDTAGNELAVDNIFSFTTASAPDTTPPTVSVTPVNNALNCSLSGNVILTFNEAMNPLTVDNTNIKLFKGGVEVNSTVSYNTGTHTVTIDPVVDLDYLTVYTVKVYTGATDASGNALASEFTSTFTTIADTTSPSVLSHTPVNNATSVAKSTNISIVFSEKLNASTVNTSNITVVKKIGGDSVAGVVTYDESSKTAGFNPSSDLEAGPTTYTVTVTTGIKDLQNNSLSSSVSWDFTTTDGTSPAVSSYTPANGATGISVVSGITITFSEAIDTTTLSTSNITVKDSSNNSIPGTFTYNSGTMTATFVPTYNLNYQTSYTVTVGTGVKDVNGNTMTGNTSWSLTTKNRKWTIIYYGDADCDLEAALMNDIAEMKIGYVDDQGIDVIVLIDRIPGYSIDSSTLGSNFTDTRLYRITNGKAERISGSTQFPEITTSSSYEANMGDATTLKKLIIFAKSNYTADKYAVILSNHGGGAKYAKTKDRIALTKGSNGQTKDICYDETSGNDFLYTAEITDNLTSLESVDLFGLDACLMSSVEFAYQFRNDGSNTGFKASIMVASAPLETGAGWAYVNILNRLKTGGGNNGTSDTTLGANELFYDPATLTAEQLGAVIVEEQRDSTVADSSQSLTCLDLSNVSTIKTAIDSLAVKFAAGGADVKTALESLRGNCPLANLLHYFDDLSYDATYQVYEDWLFKPYFDLYNLAVAINESSNSYITAAMKADALTIMNAVDAFVVYSFANSDFTTGFPSDPFLAGKSGVHIFFPDGDAQYTPDGGTTMLNYWYLQDWYNSEYIRLEYTGAPYGYLAWCRSGRNMLINTVGNWFELLDSWYDTQVLNDEDGGFNYYQW